jgi:coproporphyrinogen III oxidase
MIEAKAQSTALIPMESMRSRMEALARETRDAVAAAVEQLEGISCRENVWTSEDGGTTYVDSVLEHGEVFDKVGINLATVRGELSPAMAKAALDADAVTGDGAPSFYLAAVSIVMHARNPLVPSGHAHVRYFEVDSTPGADSPGRAWFGGLVDLTPSYLIEEDARHFHGVLRDMCEAHDASFYPRFKKWCDEYFFLAHRGEHRGIGGIFFDRLQEGDPDALLGFVRGCAASFLPAYLPIVERRREAPFSDAQRRWQHQRRSRYVEFNLLADRGTTFGRVGGVPTQSVLMALPPTAAWQYDDGEPTPGSPEARISEVLRHPRAWA